MIRIALVGQIGSGKTFISKLFGYPVFNADKEVENIAIFFIPTLDMVGSTKNQCPIIMSEKTDDTKRIGKVDFKSASPTILNDPIKKLIIDKSKI